MKIIHLAKYYLPHLGGVEIHLKEISSLLIKMGHEVTVITEQHDLKLSEYVDYNGVKVIRIPKFFSKDKFASIKKKQQTWNFIKKHQDIFDQADIIHVHDVFWWLLPIYRSIRKKTFITFHGWETEYPVRFSAKFQRYLYSKLSRGSIHVGAWIKEFYFDKPDSITYGAINAKRLTKSRDENFNKNALKNSDPSNKELNISFIGRLSKDNDIKKYIELIKILISRGQKVNITWVGDGKFYKECEQLGKVTGFVKNISKYLVNKDIIFASSYLSILEAQLLGNNVCAFYSNKLKKAYLETFPGNKYMLIADDTEAMMKKLNFLLTSPKLKKQAGQDAEKFAKKQTWKNVLNIYLKLWQKL